MKNPHSENEIENDSNNENIINKINEIENFFNDEIANNSKKIMNSNSFFLLKELEDKWDSIERK